MMKNVYQYSNLKEGMQKLTTVAEYEAAEKEFLEIGKKVNEIPPKERIPYLNMQTQEFSRLIAAPSPDVLVAVCPYCARKIWARIKHGIFTLNASYWVMEYDDGKIVTDDSKCGHLYVVDGALNLNNAPVPETIKPYSFIRTKIYMGAEVPFIKPRVLSKEGVIAVVHSISVAEKYTGYPITYFTKSPISQREFTTGWAREEYCARDEIVGEATFSGKRSEPQDYDLEKWVKQNKLRWLVETNNEFDLNTDSDIFPYYNIEGRKNPYQIQNGKVIDLPNPLEIQTNTTLETFMPG